MIEPLAGNLDERDCWSVIGVRGDRSCPELVQHVHCRNCPVHTQAARAFFDRRAPDGYLAEWTRSLAAPVVPHEDVHQSLLLARLADEWIGLRTRVVVEVTRTRPVHRIPHRSNETLVGLVNLRGQLQILVALDRLLEVSRDREGDSSRVEEDPRARLVVIRRENETWAFTAREVAGVHRFPRVALNPVPSTLANPLNSFSHAVIAWNERSVGFLDDQRLFQALRGLSS
ncbi:MAG: chemotaxis protein CheW [Isosphaeraceae bacterium]